MSGRTRIIGIGRPRSPREVPPATAAEIADGIAVPRIVAPREPLDEVASARALEDAAIAYTEVVQVLDALTRWAQTGDGSLAAPPTASIADLESAWGRWDTAHRRLIGPQRTA